MFKLNAVESTCAVEFYTVVDTSRSPVHNIPCPLHWVRDMDHVGIIMIIINNRSLEKTFIIRIFFARLVLWDTVYAPVTIIKPHLFSPSKRWLKNLGKLGRHLGLDLEFALILNFTQYSPQALPMTHLRDGLAPP